MDSQAGGETPAPSAKRIYFVFSVGFTTFEAGTIPFVMATSSF